MVIVLTAVGWGAVVLALGHVVVRRARVSERARALRPSVTHRTRVGRFARGARRDRSGRPRPACIDAAPCTPAPRRTARAGAARGHRSARGCRERRVDSVRGGGDRGAMGTAGRRSLVRSGARDVQARCVVRVRVEPRVPDAIRGWRPPRQ